MEIILPIRSLYTTVDKMKNNNDTSPHILSRLDALKELVVFVQQKDPDQLPDNVCKALEKLNTILESGNKALTEFNRKYVVGVQQMVHLVKASDYEKEFDSLSKSLTDAFVTLSGALHIQQERMLTEQDKKLVEQEKKLVEQEKKLVAQEKKLVKQEKRLVEQEKNLFKQEKRLVEQLEEQQDKLAEQEELLSRVAYGSRGFYCVVL